MKAYCCKEDFQIRYSDLDYKDRFKLSACLALMQEAAGLSADELGFGYDDLKPKNLGFVIVNSYCEFLSPVRQGEIVTVETWPLPPRHVIFERDYSLKVAGKPALNAASRWCLVDLQSFSLQPATALGETHEKCPYRDEKTVNVPSWKIPKLDAGREVYRMRVGSSQIDHYMHANNTRYADFFCDCFSCEELSRGIKSFQIVYGKQAKEGAEIVFYRQDFASESVCEAYCNGELISQFRITFEGEKV